MSDSIQGNVLEDLKDDIRTINDGEEDNFQIWDTMADMEIDGISKQGKVGAGAALMSDGIWYPKSQLRLDIDGNILIAKWLYAEYN